MKMAIPFLLAASTVVADIPRYSFTFTTDKDTKLCFAMNLAGEKTPKREQIQKDGWCVDVKANEESTIYVNPNPPFASQ